MKYGFRVFTDREVVMRPIDFLRQVVELVAGPDHGLRLSVCERGEDDLGNIEVLGPLPRELKKLLPRARAYWEPMRGSDVAWADVQVVWCPNLDGVGARYAVGRFPDLLELLAERAILLKKKSVFAAPDEAAENFRTFQEKAPRVERGA